LTTIIYGIRFSEDGKIFGIKTKGASWGDCSRKPSDLIRTEMFYCAEGFPQQEITKFLEGKLAKLPDAEQPKDTTTTSSTATIPATTGTTSTSGTGTANSKCP